jgi:hypothetical protein
MLLKWESVCWRERERERERERGPSDLQDWPKNPSALLLMLGTSRSDLPATGNKTVVVSLGRTRRSGEVIATRFASPAVPGEAPPSARGAAVRTA